MLRNRVFIAVGVVMLVLLGVKLSAYAAGNIHIGTLEIHPYAAVEQKYNDNIFLEPENQENDDWITSTWLGFAFKMPLIPGREEDFMLEADYALDALSYWDQTAQNRLDHVLTAIADFNFANDFRLKIDENFRKTADPPNSELTAQEDRIRNATQMVVGYGQEALSFDLGYMNIRDDYKNLNTLDKYEHIISGTVSCEFFPKTTVFGEYNFGKINYDVVTTNSDSDYHQTRLGLKGKIMPKLMGTVKAGYKSTDYEQAGKDDFAGITVFGNLSYELQERSIINIEGERGAVESSYSTNSYFISNRIGVGLDHQLRERLFLVAGGGYQLNTYSDETTEGSVTAKRKDQFYSTNIGLRYEMKEWVSINTRYEYRQRNSKFSPFDYENNVISTKVMLSL